MRIPLSIVPLVLVMFFSTAAIAADEEPLEVRDYQIDGLLAVTSEAPTKVLGLSWGTVKELEDEDAVDREVLGLEHPADLTVLITTLIARVPGRKMAPR